MCVFPVSVILISWLHLTWSLVLWLTYTVNSAAHCTTVNSYKCKPSISFSWEYIKINWSKKTTRNSTGKSVKKKMLHVNLSNWPPAGRMPDKSGLSQKITSPSGVCTNGCCADALKLSLEVFSALICGNGNPLLGKKLLNTEHVVVAKTISHPQIFADRCVTWRVIGVGGG